MTMKEENLLAPLFQNYARSLTAMLAIGLTQFSMAHEFWIETQALPGTNAMTLDLRVGDGFPGQQFPRSTDHIDQFFVQQGQQRITVHGEDGFQPAGVLAGLSDGTYIAGYRSTHTAITLPAEQFEAYLIEEGLEHIVDLRRQRGESDMPGREVYSRAAKALFTIGSRESGVSVNVPLGFALEIVPQADPTRLRPNDALGIQVMYAGKPLANAMLSIFDADNPKGDRSRRTDANGFAQVPLRSKGKILIAVVHMVKASAELDADWESIWASLTFNAPDSKNSS